MNWALLGGSLAAVLALAGIARALRLGGARLESEAEAIAAAEEIVSDFEGREARLAADGSGAVVFGNGSELVALRRHGARFFARRFARPLAAEASGTTVVIESGERLAGPFRLTLETEDEARLLTAMLGSAP
ncbi:MULTISPECIES: hypothetical protein [unclassified Sphingosinithalassobacter]|uniref:hypothetical protein n=1 Tax=unclassified Sphingosinithalassobacter TaxID=2676235 RepID=UPI00165DE698|nr:hypothetical protein [Sphingosinithalassobacter sp. CS137]